MVRGLRNMQPLTAEELVTQYLSLHVKCTHFLKISMKLRAPSGKGCCAHSYEPSTKSLHLQPRYWQKSTCLHVKWYLVMQAERHHNCEPFSTTPTFTNSATVSTEGLKLLCLNAMYRMSGVLCFANSTNSHNPIKQKTGVINTIHFYFWHYSTLSSSFSEILLP